MAPPNLSEITPSDESRHIIPMPCWSTCVGCTKLALSILILAFSAVCLHIWTTETAFIITLVTALITLLISAYYAIALSWSTRLYHCFAVLLLEFAGTALWAACTILLAIWTHRRLTHDFMGDTAGEYGREGYLRHLPTGLVPAKVASEHFKRYVSKRHVAATRLAGVGAGLAGLQCVLFLVTLVVFARNLKEHLEQGSPLANGAGTVKTGRISSVESASHGRQVSDVDKEQDERDRQILDPGREEFVDVTEHLHRGSETQ